MLGKFNKFIYILLVGIFFFIAIDDVMAKEKIRQIMTTDERFYYHTVKDSKFGSYAGTSASSGATKYTKYKYIGYVGNHAYCVQAESYAPSNGADYVEININDTINAAGVNGRIWTKENAYTAGCVIETVHDEAGDDNAAYVETYAALNSYLNLSRSIDFESYNSTIANYVKKAKSCYGDIKLDDDLAELKLKVKAVDSNLKVNGTGSSTYYVGSFKLSGVEDTYGGDKVSYKITLPSGVSLCTNSKCTKVNSTLTYDKAGIDKIDTFYFKATGVKAGDDIVIKVSASNSSKYGVARLWAPVKGDSQLTVTYGVITYSRTKPSVKATFNVPDIVTKNIKLVKKDEATGDFLRGANLTLKLSGGSTKSCTISDNKYSCSITIDENVSKDVYYSIVENSAPSGYIKGGEVTQTKWDLNAANEVVCYVASNEDLVETEVADCNRSYVFGEVCTVDNGNTYTIGRCNEEVDTTGLTYNEVDGKYYNSLNEVVEVLPTVPVGTNENVCYYTSGTSVVKVDVSKCNNQYTKVTNTKGNLVVEYMNNKNHIEISKVAINGDKELAGADLKICSDKPDDNGNCTIVRNTVPGQCKDVVVDENGDEVKISTEFNCENNDEDTKIVDMRWISGSISKVWSGIPKGTYYLVETVAPSGYLPLTTYVEFSIDEAGKITSEAYNNDTGKIIINNQPSHFKVIKQDSSNGKNLEGANLSICTATKNTDGSYKLDVGDDGYCVPAVLADGTSASWTSGDKAKVISGLGIGSYYLVEISAPENYTVADIIFFTLNKDGTLTDKDGNSIKNNELIMKDDPIVNQKTGELPILTIVLVGICAIAVCGFSYYYLVKNNGFEKLVNKFKKN